MNLAIGHCLSFVANVVMITGVLVLQRLGTNIIGGKLPRLQGDTLTAAGWSEMICPLSV
jgi:hypothetical protein